MRLFMSAAVGALAFLACFMLFRIPLEWSLAIGLLVFFGLALLLWEGRPTGRTTPGANGWQQREVNNVLRSGREKVKRIRNLRRGIADPALRGKVERIALIAEKIFAVLQAEPKNIPRARLFLEHYLDATTLIIRRYADLSSQGSTNPDVRRVLPAFGELLDVVEHTFQKQHDKLLANEALDLDTEIAVLRKMMEFEGV